jgi:hypothetical protein
MATTRWATVIDALLAAVRAKPGYRSPNDIAGIPVYDSVELLASEDRPTRYLVIGVSDPDGSDESGTATQSPATAGKVARDEVGVLRCWAVCQIGDVLPASARLSAIADMATVEDVLRTDPTLGLVTPRMFAQIGDRIQVRQYLAGGSVCQIEFTVEYATRI